MRSIPLFAMSALVAACSTMPAPRDSSVQQRIDESLRQAAAQKPDRPAEATAAPVALPPAVSQSLLPPLRSPTARPNAVATEPRFDLVVTDASIGQVLQSIVADTRYSVLLSPKLATPLPPTAANAATGATTEPASSRRDLMTVHLKNVTVLEALDAIRETYGYEYAINGTRIVVEPPDYQTRLYQINYTVGQRRGVSDLSVVSGASSGAGSGSGSGSSTSGGSSSSGGGGGYASTQASALSTIAKADVWGEMEDAVRTALGCQIPRATAPVARTATASSTTSGSRADVSYPGEMNLGERQRGVDGCSQGRAVIVNQTTGTVLVRGMPRELRTIERLLRAMQVNIARQVSIEAKIIDVRLNRDSQQGINWAALNKGLVRAASGTTGSLVGAPGTILGGQVLDGATTGSLLGSALGITPSATAFASGQGLILQGSQFAALLNFLETQGDVRVLSSPRIATLNNQKAVIKVGSEEPFITGVQAGTSTVGAGAAVSTPPTLLYQPFFSGIALDVTPQIDDYDQVTLHVHALVNSITEKAMVASTTVGAPSIPFAVNSVSETDSVVKTPDGSIVVIGGLMTESAGNQRNAVPGVGDVPVAGAFFRKGEQTSSKRELVILIKPTVVKSEADWAADVAATQQRISVMGEPSRSGN